MSDSGDASSEEDGVFPAVCALLPLIVTQYAREDCRDSVLSGDMYYKELINGHHRRFQEAARMEKETFFLLLRALVSTSLLRSSTRVCAGEKLMIFLHVLSGYSNRDVQERWQHSGETVSRTVEWQRLDTKFLCDLCIAR